MIMVSLPILTSSHLSGDENAESSANTGSRVSQRTEYFTTASNLLKSGADAVERLMSSYKEIVELAGYTRFVYIRINSIISLKDSYIIYFSRVSEMFQVFDDVSEGIYSKTTVADETTTQGIIEFRNGQPVANGKKMLFQEFNF